MNADLSDTPSAQSPAHLYITAYMYQRPYLLLVILQIVYCIVYRLSSVEACCIDSVMVRVSDVKGLVDA